jgi:hypothetical protein
MVRVVERGIRFGDLRDYRRPEPCVEYRLNRLFRGVTVDLHVRVEPSGN